MRQYFLSSGGAARRRNARDELMGMAEKKILEVALAEAGLVKKNAADLLGITFRSFRYRMDRFGIE